MTTGIQNEKATITTIGNQDVEVWPEHCIRVGRNCSQCFLEGKIQCSPAARQSLNLPRDEKEAIAKEAKERGIKVVASEKGLPWVMVRAWVGAYCRERKDEVKPPTVIGHTPRAYHRKAKKEPLTPEANHPKPCKPISVVTLMELDPGNCLFCENRILDICEEDKTPWYLDTPKGRQWFCWGCAEGLKRVFDALDIPCELKTKQ